jgi:hypothetical protein
MRRSSSIQQRWPITSGTLGSFNAMTLADPPTLERAMREKIESRGDLSHLVDRLAQCAAPIAPANVELRPRGELPAAPCSQ